MTLDWSRDELARGLECYQREEFFEAHEHWEAVWLRSHEPEKTFLQALIQITAAFHHLQRQNTRGAKSLLQSALRRLTPYPARFGGLDVSSLRRDVESWAKILEGDGPPKRGQVPRIKIDVTGHEMGAA